MASQEITDLMDGVEDSKLLELAQQAEAAERYEDMCVFSKTLVERATASKRELEVNERNSLSVAYKNVVGSKRASWRSMSHEYEEVDNELLVGYRVIVEEELSRYCAEVIKLMEDYHAAVVKGHNDETEVFYLKMTADYYRYWAEFSGSEEHAAKADEKYGQAWKIAAEEDHLAKCHPTRLGLALNWSVCKYEILKKPAEACELAKSAFDHAIEQLDSLADAQYKDATLIMQLLRDNLTLWTSEAGDEDEPADE